MRIPNFAAKHALTDDATLDNLVKQADIESANALDTLQRPSPRFEIVFINGVWVQRDLRYWYHSAGPFRTRKAAE